MAVTKPMAEQITLAWFLFAGTLLYAPIEFKFLFGIYASLGIAIYACTFSEDPKVLLRYGPPLTLDQIIILAEDLKNGEKLEFFTRIDTSLPVLEVAVGHHFCTIKVRGVVLKKFGGGTVYQLSKLTREEKKELYPLLPGTGYGTPEEEPE